VLAGVERKLEEGHRDALWHVVHDLCVTDMQARGGSAPCAEVSLDGGYAVVKDAGRRTQLLLVPTRRIAGIESPALQARGAPNYWQAAWSARPLFEKGAGRQVPRQDLALAINSAATRTQDQLHIHIDCIRPDVLAALQADASRLGPRWRTLSDPLLSGGFRARWISGQDLRAADPFKLLARDPDARPNLAQENLLVAGAERGGRPGFILVSHRDDGADTVSAETLLDHACRVLGAEAPAS
jgi:CDP-diacylglycerol pyrophosphatase